MSMSRRLILLLLLPCLALTACVSKSKAKAEAQKAFVAGQTQALQAKQAQETSITVLGQVRNHSVPWEEGLTLAQAIDAAVYTGFSNPRTIRLTRGEESAEIKVSDLLRGVTNPPLEAGDVIELLR